MSIARIAISQRVVDADGYSERRDAISWEICEWLQNLFPSAAQLALGNHPSMVEAWWEQLKPDLLILSGGNNLGDVKRRDDTEVTAIKLALKQGTPIFGICRGLHILNYVFGGKFPRELGKSELESEVNHVGCNHEVLLVDYRLKSALNRDLVVVNSYHNQGLFEQDAGRHLSLLAKSSEGVIEAVCHKSQAVAAVQWHPERKFSNPVLENEILNKFVLGRATR